MTPPSIRDIRDDNELLDNLGARRYTGDDEFAGMLAAWVDEIDDQVSDEKTPGRYARVRRSGMRVGAASVLVVAALSASGVAAAMTETNLPVFHQLGRFTHGLVFGNHPVQTAQPTDAVDGTVDTTTAASMASTTTTADSSSVSAPSTTDTSASSRTTSVRMPPPVIGSTSSSPSSSSTSSSTSTSSSSSSTSGPTSTTSPTSTSTPTASSPAPSSPTRSSHGPTSPPAPSPTLTRSPTPSFGPGPSPTSTVPTLVPSSSASSATIWSPSPLVRPSH